MREYERQLQTTDGVRFSYSASMFVAIGDGPRKAGEQDEATVWFDRVRHRIREVKSSVPPSVAGTVTPPVKMERVACGDRLLEGLVEPDGDVARTLSSRLEMSVEEWHQFVSGFYFSALLGYVPFRRGGDSSLPTYLPDALKQMELRIRESQSNGVPVVVVEGETSVLAIELWLDPAAAFAARRMSFQRKEYRADPSLFESYLYEVAAFRECNGVYFPSQFQVTKVRPTGLAKDADFARDAAIPQSALRRPCRTLVCRAAVGAVELGAELAPSDFEFGSKIVNGTSVHMEDAPHLSFVWQDGQIVPAIDTQAVESAKASRFLGGPGAAVLWIVAVNIVVFSVVLWFFLRARLRRKPKAIGRDANPQ